MPCLKGEYAIYCKDVRYWFYKIRYYAMERFEKNKENGERHKLRLPPKLAPMEDNRMIGIVGSCAMGKNDRLKRAL